ncbi:MAG: hypothetical protein ACLRXQ_11090 [Phascolarctobacterium faecium]
MGISPDANQLRRFEKSDHTIKDNQVKYVFFETLVSQDRSNCWELGAETLVLDPLEGLSKAGRNNGDDYLKS